MSGSTAGQTCKRAALLVVVIVSCLPVCHLDESERSQQEGSNTDTSTPKPADERLPSLQRKKLLEGSGARPRIPLLLSGPDQGPMQGMSRFGQQGGESGSASREMEKHL